MISSVLTKVYKNKNNKYVAVFVVGSSVRFYTIKDELLDVCTRRVGLPTFPLLDSFVDKNGKTIVYCIGVGIPVV